MKFFFISFQNINNNIPTGMVKFMLPILDKMKFSNSSIYYVSSCKNYNGSINIKNIGIFFKFINRVFKRLYHMERLDFFKKYFLIILFHAN